MENSNNKSIDSDAPKIALYCNTCNSPIYEGDEYKQLRNRDDICIPCSFFQPEHTIMKPKTAKIYRNKIYNLKEK